MSGLFPDGEKTQAIDNQLEQQSAAGSRRGLYYPPYLPAKLYLCCLQFFKNYES